jgi:GT2 family glycosyltransferase
MTTNHPAERTAAPDGAGSQADCALSIIVVSWNTRAMTLECLDSIIAETRDTPYELIVIDNASSDGSADAIAAAHPQARLLRSDENLGFARANNVAAREARGARLLLLNPDTVVLRGAIDRLVRFAQARPEAGIWGGRTLFADGALNPACCWRDISLWNLFCRAAGLTGLFPRSALFNSEAYGGWLRDDEREVDIVQGSFFLIDAALWRRLDGFDETFVMYGEEADLCLRARAMGARPRMTPEAEIIHYGGASQTVRADRTVRLLKAKNTIIAKHWRNPARGMGLWLSAMWPLSRSLAGRAAGLVGRGDGGGVWSEVWRRRNEWRDGYAATEA